MGANKALGNIKYEPPVIRRMYALKTHGFSFNEKPIDFRPKLGAPIICRYCGKQAGVVDEDYLRDWDLLEAHGRRRRLRNPDKGDFTILGYDGCLDDVDYWKLDMETIKK